MGQLCAKCVQLLCDFALRVKKFSVDLMFDIKECLTQVLNCPCLKRKNFETRQLYKPAFQTQEEEIAQEFLQHIEKGFEASPLSKVSLEALRTLAFSENPGLQMSAAAYYLQMSQYMNIQLPPEHLETYYALLKSNDLEVQQISSLSLLNFLLEGNVSKQHVMQMDLLEPILELLDSDDTTVQCNSCACIMTLAVSDVSREAIATAGGVIPLLALSKSYNPRVQQNAVGAIFNLTQSEWIQQLLFQQGALPILICLLESPDSQVQYYSCAALSNMAMNSWHHEAMLHIGNRFLLRTLLPLLSSPVDKVSNQACVCLRNLATNESVQTSIVALPILPLLFPLLASDNAELQQNAIILLRLLSQHPANQDKLMCDEVLQILGKLLLAWKTHPVVIGHAACFLQNLSCSESMPKIVKSPCIEGLLQTVLSADFLEEESLSCVISCLAELLKHERAIACILELIDEPLIDILLRLAGQVEQTETSFQTAFIIKCIIQHGNMVFLLKQHMNKVQEYLMKYLSHQENRFQQLGISTLCLLQKDSEFLSAFSQNQMKKYLDQVHQQTEETQELLSVAMKHMDT
uniref:Vacuolar protein 8 n=1 Tax=Pogona vitticeps TaxID=103695 RepID=A0A6J0U7Z5_9SAUR